MMVIDASIVKRHIKPKADSTLLNMKKSDLVEYIRTLEHNYNVAVLFNEQQARNIETMIKNGDIAPYWISVEDSLPEESGTYIVVASDGHAKRVTFVKWQKRNKLWELTGARSYWRITHWMPLPAGPVEADCSKVNCPVD